MGGCVGGNGLSIDLLLVRFKKVMGVGVCAAATVKVHKFDPRDARQWLDRRAQGPVHHPIRQAQSGAALGCMKVRDGASLERLPSGPRKGSSELARFFCFLWN